MRSGMNEKVCAAFAANPAATSAELAAMLDCNPAYIRATLTRKGKLLARSRLLKPPKPPRTTPVRKYRKLQDWETQAILDGLKSGEKLDSLAVEFDVDISTVSLVGKKNGLSRKPDPQHKLISYRGVGFSEALESAVLKFARVNKIGFGAAVRKLIVVGLKAP